MCPVGLSHRAGSRLAARNLGGDFRVKSISQIEQRYGATFILVRQFDVDCAMFRDWFSKRQSVDLVLGYTIAGREVGHRVLSGCTIETYAESARDARSGDECLDEIITVRISEVGPFVKVERQK